MKFRGAHSEKNNSYSFAVHKFVRQEGTNDQRYTLSISVTAQCKKELIDL